MDSNKKLKPIALLIPVYNRPSELTETLNSLSDQLSVLDIVLVDDGSDKPLQLDNFKDFPVYLIRLKRNMGIVSALNAGLEYIYSKNYEFIARLDSDDKVINLRFLKQLDFLREHPDIGLVGSNFYVADSSGLVISHSVRPSFDKNIRSAMHLGCVIGHSTIMMRTSVAKLVGYYREEYSTAEDYDFFWRALSVTKVANMSEKLLIYRCGSSESISNSRRLKQAFTALRIKICNFEIKNFYSYLGLLVSLLDVTNTLKYTLKIRKKIMDFMFPENKTIGKND